MKAKTKSNDGTLLIQWFQDQLGIVSAEFNNFTSHPSGEYLGEHRQPMLTSLADQAKGMSRDRFQKWLDGWFQKLKQAEVDCLYYLELHFQYQVEFSEVWEIKSCPQDPELTTSVQYKSHPLRPDFLQIGGEPDWVQEPEIPICPKCDGDMAMLLQLSSPSGSEVKDHPKLKSYIHGDAGKLFLMGCQKCAQYSTVWQCY